MYNGLNSVRPISLTLLGLTFVYIFLRAAFVPLFSDEVSTFFRYVQTGGFQPFLIEPNANNHVLNSLLTHLSFLLFGDSPLALRLPNVLSFLLFAFYVLKFQRFFSNPMLAICWVLIMVGSHYFISFFHLTRGYGMSMAFLLASIFHAIHYLKKGRLDHLFALCLFANLAAWANLSLLVPLLAIFGIVALRLVGFSINRYTVKERIAAAVLFVLSGALPFFYAIQLALDLKEVGALYHGTGEGFIDVIVGRLMAEFIPERWTIASWFFWPLFLIYLIGMVWILWKKRGDSAFYIVQEIFWLTIIGTIAMHLILDVHYPLDRAALHFFLLFVLALFFVLTKLRRSLALPTALLPALLLLFQQISFFNFNRTSHWDNEHVPVSIIDDLKKWQDSTGIQPLISTHGLPGRVFVYNEYRKGAGLNSPKFEGFPAASADFILTYQWHEQYPEGFVTRAEYPDIKMKVLERKVHDDWQFLSPAREMKGTGLRTKDGQDLGTFEVDGRAYQAISVSFDGWFQSDDYPYKGWLALRITDTTDQELSFYYIDLARVKPDMKNKQRIQRRLFQDRLPEQPLKIELALMNVGGNLYTLEDIRVSLQARLRTDHP
ncbi:MAG: ArnT family glycosyltransferase [Bacteroidia bacterium]